MLINKSGLHDGCLQAGSSVNGWSLARGVGEETYVVGRGSSRGLCSQLAST
jgi:hypothetical protein